MDVEVDINPRKSGVYRVYAGTATWVQYRLLVVDAMWVRDLFDMNSEFSIYPPFHLQTSFTSRVLAQ
jgi:hypothetical protein